MSNPLVTLKQVSPYIWQLIAPKGHVMVDDLQFSDLYRAESWIKAYISSFPTWKYEMLPIRRKK